MADIGEVLVSSLQLLDPILQFITRATGRPLVPLSTLKATLPKQTCARAAKSALHVSTDRSDDDSREETIAQTPPLSYIPELTRRGVLHIEINAKNGDRTQGDDFHGGDEISSMVGAGDVSPKTKIEWDRMFSQRSETVMVGFPPYESGVVGNPSPSRVDSREVDPLDPGDKTRQKGRGESTKKRTGTRGGLHGSTKAAAKRRLAALRKSLKADPPTTTFSSSLKSKEKRNEHKRRDAGANQKVAETTAERSRPIPRRSYAGVVEADSMPSGAQLFQQIPQADKPKVQENENCDEFKALRALKTLFTESQDGCSSDPELKDSICKRESAGILNRARLASQDSSFILPNQAKYAGSQPRRPLRHGTLSPHTLSRIPRDLVEALDVCVDQKCVNASVQPSCGDTTSIIAAASCVSSPQDGVASPSQPMGPERNALHEEKESSLNISCRHGRRLLYSHQAAAVEAVMNGVHTIVCTGTGSGKSICYLLPALADAMSACDCSNDAAVTSGVIDEGSGAVCENASLFIFPTKALAQDQLSKLHAFAVANPALQASIRAGTIDGDTPHADRNFVAKNCNIILTNPDTLHAAILPGWKTQYRALLARLHYVVVDEAHVYEGTFGTHVSLVLSRLVRLCTVSKNLSKDRSGLHLKTGIPTFVACSATMTSPEEHFRLLCPIPRNAPIKALYAGDDGSPCSPKHFIVWNPPLLDMNGTSTGTIEAKADGHETNLLAERHATRSVPSNFDSFSRQKTCHPSAYSIDSLDEDDNPVLTIGPSRQARKQGNSLNGCPSVHRRHAADETAHLLVEAVKNNVRVIAFCKTRSLVEWVYERCISNLRSSPDTSHLAEKIESYRGGYTAEARRSIERRLFRNQLLGVVGTCALELGVDIGGIDLTLHCGYPGSINSLLQQSGRAGRGGRTETPSFSIMVCFNSPGEQHLWRHPAGLLSRGVGGQCLSAPDSSLCQGHLLCAAKEHPLLGPLPAHTLVVCSADSVSMSDQGQSLPTDHELFGSSTVYNEALKSLLKKCLLRRETVSVANGMSSHNLTAFTSHPSVDRPWAQISMRSIEPLSYFLVDLSHPLQGKRTDGIHSTKAIMDTIPYSRVFYHAYPGAIIMHRGKRYKVHSLARPPVSLGNLMNHFGGRSESLPAYALPTSVRYSTRALSLMHITVVKRLESVEISPTTFKDHYCDGEYELKQITGTSLLKDSGESFAGSILPDDSIGNASSMIITPAKSNDPNLSGGTIAGNGVVTVKRTVHGYAKLSMVTRVELSRHEITLPPMEFDTNAFWIDAEASALCDVLPNYDAGVHALSHAILAVTPLFVPCTTSDIDCDHSKVGCTRVLLFDKRAGGGTHTSELVWRNIFRPEGVLAAAINLLEDCATCRGDKTYDGGCPGCLQTGACISFNQNLSRKAGLVIGRRMLRRIEQTDEFKRNRHIYLSPSAALIRDGDAAVACPGNSSTASPPSKVVNKQVTPNTEKMLTPRRKARARALIDAKDLVTARKRQIVVGRPTWPMDILGGVQGGLCDRVDNDTSHYIIGPSVARAGGFMEEEEFCSD